MPTRAKKKDTTISQITSLVKAVKACPGWEGGWVGGWMGLGGNRREGGAPLSQGWPSELRAPRRASRAH